MKRKLLTSLAFTVLTIFLLASCGKESIEKNSIELNDDIANIKSLVSALKFDTTGIKIDGDKITVEGDIVLSKSALLKTVPRQAKVRPNTPLNQPVTCYISTAFSASERAVIQEALDLFKVVVLPGYGRASLELNYTAIESAANIKVLKVSWGANSICGEAPFPTEIQLGGGISPFVHQVNSPINLNSYYWDNLNDSQRKFLVAHEFGHSIGIRHTNWRGQGEPENVGGGVGAYTVPGTDNSSTNPDPNSVFNGSTCGLSWSGFTNNDLKAIISSIGGVYES
ncbi:M57 family metalloprotease [Olivibacter jilunii]|uniref:M57 family metalloprotease n=1 Tax=Olivibacter jilunii TaxID=985016 RepID=UPI003F1680DC